MFVFIPSHLALQGCVGHGCWNMPFSASSIGWGSNIWVSGVFFRCLIFYFYGKMFPYVIIWGHGPHSCNCCWILWFQPSSFFTEQLTAFEVWLDHGSEHKKPPEQLPIVLQVWFLLLLMIYVLGHNLIFSFLLYDDFKVWDGRFSDSPHPFVWGSGRVTMKRE